MEYGLWAMFYLALSGINVYRCLDKRHKGQSGAFQGALAVVFFGLMLLQLALIARPSS